MATMEQHQQEEQSRLKIKHSLTLETPILPLSMPKKIKKKIKRKKGVEVAKRKSTCEQDVEAALPPLLQAREPDPPAANANNTSKGQKMNELMEAVTRIRDEREWTLLVLNETMDDHINKYKQIAFSIDRKTDLHNIYVSDCMTEIKINIEKIRHLLKGTTHAEILHGNQELNDHDIPEKYKASLPGNPYSKIQYTEDENPFGGAYKNDLTTKDITKEECVKMLQGTLEIMESHGARITNFYNLKINNNGDVSDALANTKFALITATDYIRDKITALNK
jgi:hypothetical protein